MGVKSPVNRVVVSTCKGPRGRDGGILQRAQLGQLSDDGQWWWDGSAWISTAQLVLPKLPPTALEQSGRVTAARERLAKYGFLYGAKDFNLAAIALLPLYLRGQPAIRDYRSWSLEQLDLATAYLLGPDESMLAGETTLIPPAAALDSWKRDMAVAVTSAHVVVFRFDSLHGQPRRIALAARARDVAIELRPRLQALLHGPALTVSRRSEHLVIQGSPGMFNPDPVVVAWRQAARSTG